MKKPILFLMICSILLVAGGLPLSATTLSAEAVFDNAELLSPAEEAAIQTAAQQARELTGIPFYVVTRNARSYDAPDAWGDEFLDAQGISDRADVVILIVTKTQEYHYYIYRYGDSYARISDKETDWVLDSSEVFDNIKSGNLEEGICAFLKLSAKAYNGRVGASYLLIGLIAFTIALVIGVIACVCVWSSYKRKKRPVDYPLDRFAKLDLKEQDDIFTGSFVTKRVIQTNSGGGGRGGGSRGGGHVRGR